MTRAMIVIFSTLAWCGGALAEDAAAARVELRLGEKYFRVSGAPAFVLGRNPAGVSATAFDDHFQHAADAGERFMRLHFTFMPENEKAGEIDPGVLEAWDAMLDAAEKRGLVVMP